MTSPRPPVTYLVSELWLGATDGETAAMGAQRGISACDQSSRLHGGSSQQVDVAAELAGGRRAGTELGWWQTVVIIYDHLKQMPPAFISENHSNAKSLVTIFWEQYKDGLLMRTKSEDILSQLSVNLIGPIHTCKIALRSMVQQQGGAIVNIGSVVGHKGNAGQSIYSASKEGLVGFSKSLAKEVARKNIRVNVVAPGFIHTDMTSSLDKDLVSQSIPLSRFGEAEEVAHAVAFLLESPYVTGHVLVVDGGLQLQI
ncbi:hypothetical protein AB205_0129200 [Aquarana catesbeiana]|uniref:3-ketoacyl-[acyl-carrier-protein] reductase beta subunit n=1 Tax=Aquarana catesbeiana TaxID=8400 RepID=A0A2G9P5W9_AQUCT|nr:hypothetical protein AB205_0129200 [Aquarana catesbeiana]